MPLSPRSGLWTASVVRVMLPPICSKGDPFLSLPSFWWSPAVLGVPQLVAASLSSDFTWLSSLSVCVCANLPVKSSWVIALQSQG